MTYVEYQNPGCGTTFVETPLTYNQTQFTCANNGLDSVQCLADRTGVTVTRWAPSFPTSCAVVQFTKNFKFGDCAEITTGSLYRKFTACVGSASHSNMDGKKMFMVLVGVLMSSLVMGTF
jgi:hypothetical protein